MELLSERRSHRRSGLRARDAATTTTTTSWFVVLSLMLVLVAAAAAAAAAAASPPSLPTVAVAIGTGGRWSDPNTWQAQRVPSPGDAVIIPQNTFVYLDANATLSSLTISGAGAVLSCVPNSNSPPADIALDIATTFAIEQGGCFSCGAGDCLREPEAYERSLVVRLGARGAQGELTAAAPPPSSAENDTRTLLVQDGGSLYLNGRERAVAITRLADHAMAGSTSIAVSDVRVGMSLLSSSSSSATGWQVGDLIAIAATDNDPAQTEYRRIVGFRDTVASPSSSSSSSSPASSSLCVIELDAPLAYSHNGRVLEIVEPPSSSSSSSSSANNNNAALLNRRQSRRIVDTRAEVALLSRNIVIEGVAGDPTGMGGDVKIMGRNSKAWLKWVEMRYLGRRGHMGRYPLHLHGASNDGIVVSGVAIHDSYQRGLVLHCTSNAQVTNTVVSGVYGFAFMLEDGAEEGNLFAGNLAMDVVSAIPGTTGNVITEHGNPSGFWFVNPNNAFVDNMAAGVQGSGYSWEMLRNRTAAYTLCPQEVPGYDVQLLNDKQYADLDNAVYGAMMRKNLAAFRNNSAHSMRSGLWFRSAGGQEALSSSIAKASSLLPAKQSVVEDLVVWRIYPRVNAPPGVEGSHHDACIHVSEISRLRFERCACVNSGRAFWSSQSQVLQGTLMAWSDTLVKGDGSGRGRGRGRGGEAGAKIEDVDDDDQWRTHNVAFVSYTKPQTFIDTRVYGRYGKAVFRAMGTGSPASAHTLVRGVWVDDGDGNGDGDGGDGDAAAGPRPPPQNQQAQDIAGMISQTPHVFTDVDGSWLGKGAGARVLASCLGCGLRSDPILDVYAPGACVPMAKTTTTTTTVLPMAVGGAAAKAGPSSSSSSSSQEYVSGVFLVPPVDGKEEEGGEEEEEQDGDESNSTPLRVRAEGAAPLVCSATTAAAATATAAATASTAPPPPSLAVVWLTMSGAAAAEWQLDVYAPAADIRPSSSGRRQRQYLRAVTRNLNPVVAHFIVPLTRESADPFGGGYVVAPPPTTRWAGINAVTIALGSVPLDAPYKSLTLVLAGVPEGARYSVVNADGTQQPSSGDDEVKVVVVVGGGGGNTAATCPAVVAACSARTDDNGGSSSDMLCVCRDSGTGDVYVRPVVPQRGSARERQQIDPTFYGDDGAGNNYLLRHPGLRASWG